MKITYIGHSGFAVELKTVVFLFDYFNGKIPQFPTNKKLVVLCSHKHPDHFNPVIFDLADQYPDVIYLLSKEIRGLTKGIESGQIHYLEKNAHYEFTFEETPFTLDTLRSTDLGVAFLIHTEGKVIYHAGDLNWWAWKGAKKSSWEHMAAKFQEEIARLEGKYLDVAFLTLDPRQEEYYALGMDYFLKHVDVGVAFAMHFWEKFEVISKFKMREEAKNYRDKVMEIQKQGQVFYTPS